MVHFQCVLSACSLNMFRGHDQERDGSGGMRGEEGNQGSDGSVPLPFVSEQRTKKVAVG